jgi:hypothetical protein
MPMRRVHGSSERCVELGDELVTTAAAEQLAGACLVLARMAGRRSGGEITVEVGLVAPDSGAESNRGGGLWRVRMWQMRMWQMRMWQMRMHLNPSMVIR